MLELAAAAIAKVFAQGHATRDGGRKNLFDSTASVVALDFDYADAKPLVSSCEGNENGEAVVTSNRIAAVGYALSRNLDNITNL
jgi:hypothetical protein